MQAPSSSQPVAFQDVTVDAGGKRLGARVGGTGTPLVLFHSLLADQSSWDRIVQPLAATHRVVVLNLPGFGASDAVGSSLEGIADHIAAALPRFEFARKPVFMGNGYGGFVALMTAIRHPGIAARLVLADCGACFSEPGRAAFRGMSAAAKDKGLGAIADVAMRRLFAPEFQEKNPDLIADRKKKFLAVDAATFHGACDALATLDVRDKLKSVTVPALVLVGAQDEATPPPMARELASGLPNAKLVELPGLAHVPQLQAPDVFLQAIRPFIDQA